MKRLIDLTNEEARAHFMKGRSYFNGDFPRYISFEPILRDVDSVLKGRCYSDFQASKPGLLPNVNYNFIANKDGRFAWRPFELMHPAIYVSLVNVICAEENWGLIKKRFGDFEDGIVDCCSAPVMSVDHQSDVATQVRSWWQSVEQRSMVYSLEFSHLLHTDVTDCYGSIYTHSISWAIHGLEDAKRNKDKNSLLGNKIDAHIQASRYGQTNGIAQGSVLMDFIAELVLGYVDSQINAELRERKIMNIRILRYRDDFRIFANSDEHAELVLKVVSDNLMQVGMKLGVAKTIACLNVVEGSIKPDKLAGIEWQDLGSTNAKTIQKQLLRLHSFGQKFTNSGALRRLISEFHSNVSTQKDAPDDLDVQVAIATDIAFVSPSTFPAVAGILSHLISLEPNQQKKILLWEKVLQKMSRVPYNGYLQIWLQRVTQPKAVGISFNSSEPICRIVNGEELKLWETDWIASDDLKQALDVSKIIIAAVNEEEEVVLPEEVKLFKENAWVY
ncbi:MAG: RNA-directed DNA polymerase [Desulfobulbaceae bacterium]|nr:RNA-directed DNA polymerase [Desulfobulbaceae bacterium]